MAQIFNRAASFDNILILGTRESATQPFNAPNWTDLRVGMFLSVTQPVANDTPTGLAESFAASVPNNNPADWFYIGLKDSSPNLPLGPQSSFIGFSNVNFLGTPNVQLVTSDLGLGSAAYYWRPVNDGGTQTFIASDKGFVNGQGGAAVQSHFFQSADPGNPAPSGYYCGMLGFRLLRSDPNSASITVQIPQIGTNSSDMFWTNAPTAALLLSKLDPWPTTIVTLGPVNVTVPTALFCYWPFRLSRLRISAWGILRSA